MNKDDMAREGIKEEQITEEVADNSTMDNIEQPSTSDAPKKMSKETVTAVLIDQLLDCLRNGYLADFFKKNEKWLIKTGLFGLYISACLGLAASIVLPLRYDLRFVSCLGIGFVWFFTCIVIHYTAWKFFPVLSNIIQSTPTKLSSKAFLDSFALITGIAGVISIVSGLFLWIRTSSFNDFLAGIFIFVFCEYIMSLCLNPTSLSIEITEKTSAGEEFLGLIAFFMKGFLKLIPIIFCIGILSGIINLLGLIFMKFEYTGQINAKVLMIWNMTTAALFPLIGYLFFLVYYFVIDLAMAILSVPAKLDRIYKHK